MEFKEFLLNEMRLHKSGESDYMHLVAYRSNVWVFDYRTVEEEFLEEMVETIISDFNVITRQELQRGESGDRPNVLPPTSYDIDSVMDWAEEFAEGMTGYWNPSDRVIYMKEMRSPYGSNIVRKVVQTLNAKGVQQDNEQLFVKKRSGYGNEDYQSHFSSMKYKRSKMTGNVPDVMFHGTSTKYIEGILRIGLAPGEGGEGNYDDRNVVHHNLIFLTDDKDKAIEHAFHAATKTQTQPVLLQTRIPDKALLVADYDATRFASGDESQDTYNHIEFPIAVDKRSALGPFKTSKNLGWYGYKGRIAPSHISGVYLWVNDRWRKMNQERFKKRLQNWGSEEAMYFYGIE
jgi:hypothetical protein